MESGIGDVGCFFVTIAMIALGGKFLVTGVYKTGQDYLAGLFVVVMGGIFWYMFPYAWTQGRFMNIEIVIYFLLFMFLIVTTGIFTTESEVRKGRRGDGNY